MADSHSALATRIEVDVERPLRDFATSNREMQAMSTIQGNLISLAKELERAQQKTDKLRGKGERVEAGKVASANLELDNAQSQWDSQAPYVFETLQAVDETRLNLLRDVLTQFQTHEVDLVQKSQTSAEHCLNVLLSLQTEDEIKMWALKMVQGKPRIERAQRPSIPSPASHVGRPSPARAAGSSSNLAPTRSHPDNESQRSGSVQEEKKKSRFSGLKRLGTVVGGKRRESRIPPGLSPMAETPEPKQKSSPFNSFAGRRNKMQELPSLDPAVESPSRERPQSPLRVGSEIMEPSSASREVPSSPVPAQIQVNGAVSATGSVPALAPSIPNGSDQVDLAGLDPPKPSQLEPQAEPERDSEGFSIPSKNLDPISQIQADAAAAAGETAAPAFSVNIRNAPIQEESGDSAATLASVANKLVSLPRTFTNATTNPSRSKLHQPSRAESAPCVDGGKAGQSAPSIARTSHPTSHLSRKRSRLQTLFHPVRKRQLQSNSREMYPYNLVHTHQAQLPILRSDNYSLVVSILVLAQPQHRQAHSRHPHLPWGQPHHFAPSLDLQPGITPSIQVPYALVVH